MERNFALKVIANILDRIQSDKPIDIGLKGENGGSFMVLPVGGHGIRVLAYEGGRILLSIRGRSDDILHAYDQAGGVVDRVILGEIKTPKTILGVTFKRD